jgi:agmatinase
MAIGSPDSVRSFGDLDLAFCDYQRSRVAILPVPYDLTTTYQKGSDKGPKAILEASSQLELFDIETGTEVYRQGIATLDPLITEESPEILAMLVEDEVARILDDNKLPVLLGGEHSISCGAFRAMAKRFPGISVLQIDAHLDTRESYLGSRFNHACVMARARELCPIVQVGVRSMAASEISRLDRDRVFFAHELQGNREWMHQAVALLNDKVYLTFDLDAFDSSLMPATGTPEPGGLMWWQAMGFLRELAQARQVVGFDVVELRPLPGNAAPDFLAAKLLYQFLSYLFLRSEPVSSCQRAT